MLRDFSSVLLHSKLLKSGLSPATVSLLQSHIDAKWFPHSIILEFQAKYEYRVSGNGALIKCKHELKPVVFAIQFVVII